MGTIDRLIEVKGYDSLEAAETAEGDRTRELNSSDGIFAYSDAL